MTSTFPLSSPTTPLPYSKSKPEGKLSNELYNANPTALLVSSIKKITLAGDVVKDDEFYLGVFIARWRAPVVTSPYYDRQALARDDGALTETAPDIQFFTRFRRPLNRDIMLASAVLPKNTIEFVALLQAGGNRVLFEIGRAHV